MNERVEQNASEASAEADTAGVANSAGASAQLVDTAQLPTDAAAVAVLAADTAAANSKAAADTAASGEEAAAAPAPGGASLGVRLRHAREARSLTLSDAAQALKITQHQVEAMESGQYERLPGSAFVRGFLRNYARYLQIDIQGQMPDLDDDSGGGKKQKNISGHAVHRLPPSAPVSLEWLGAGVPLVSSERRKKSFGWRKLFFLLVFGLIVLLALAAYFDWFKMGAAYIEKAEEAFNGGARENHSLNGGDVVTLLPPAVAANGAANGDEAAPAAASEALMGPSSAPLVGGGEGEKAAAEGALRLQFHAAAKSHITVTNASGAVLFEGDLEGGKQRVVKGAPPLQLEISNADVVRLEKNGKDRVPLRPHTGSDGWAKLTVR